jgi:hypothetical protein
MLKTKWHPERIQDQRGIEPSGRRPARGGAGTSAEVQVRTCVRCGRHTTFLPDDLAGGWYVCSACGRNA